MNVFSFGHTPISFYSQLYTNFFLFSIPFLLIFYNSQIYLFLYYLFTNFSLIIFFIKIFTRTLLWRMSLSRNCSLKESHPWLFTLCLSMVGSFSCYLRPHPKFSIIASVVSTSILSIVYFYSYFYSFALNSSQFLL